MTAKEFDSLRVGDWLTNAIVDKAGNIGGWNYKVIEVSPGTVRIKNVSISTGIEWGEYVLFGQELDNWLYLRKTDKPVRTCDDVSEEYHL